MFFKGSSFCLENNLLRRKTQNVPQMVLPMNVRNMVMKMGHKIPWAGHLGCRKMFYFYFLWPGMTKYIAEFCKRCPECQSTAPKIPKKSPFMPLPVIEVPFQWLGMDIVGPVERSKAGNKYRLVICDYARF